MRPKSPRYRVLWCGVDIQITEVPDYLWKGTTHLELHVIRPKKAPLPITETGYRSHFIDILELDRAGGAIRFITTWLDAEANTKGWRKRQQQLSQLSFLDLLISPPKRRASKKRTA